jgi:VCBS repeat-containing protein
VPPTTPTSTLTMLSITEGNVFIKKAGTDNWILGQVGMTLEPGDTIKTDPTSNAEITFFDGSSIELQAGTQIEIVSLDISPNTGSTTITLDQTIGTTISRVTKLLDPASSYEVETPTGVAAVRGSSMLVQVIAGGITWVTNLEGEIWVTANGVELQVPQGGTCIIGSGGSPQLFQFPVIGGWPGGGAPPNSDIAISKMPDLTHAHEGDTVTYTYTVTNPGSEPLSDVSVTDDKVEHVNYQSGDTNGDGKLDTDETWVFTATHTITADDPSPLVNNGAAAGTNSLSQTIIAWTSASVDILQPAIAINKTAEPVEAHEGDIITYTYTVTNPGNVPLSNVSVTDDKIGDANYQSGDTNGDGKLDIDETWVFTATYDVTDEDPGRLVNTATVSGTDALSCSVESEATASVAITHVNHLPVAVNDSYTTDEDTTITVVAPGVLGNDYDPDGDTLNVTAVNTSGTVGNVTAWGADGSFSYDPNGQFEYLPAGSSTTDSFTYTVSDGKGGTDNATVSINITGVNDLPVAVDDTYITSLNTPVTIPVLSNDFDPDSDTLTVLSAANGTHGAVINNGSNVTYTPAGSFTGADSFTYTISDGNGGTATATVTVTVTGTFAQINAQIDTGAHASIYIWDNTTAGWAIDENTGWSINGTNHVTPASINVAGGHYYYVWVGAENTTYLPKNYPKNWISTSAPVGDSEAAYGYAAVGILYPVHFTVKGG